MQTNDMITAQEFCVHHKVEMAFIQSVNQSGLIEMIQLEKDLCVPVSQLPQLEKIVRLYYEMDINMEGIETITYLLHRMQVMQQKIVQLNNRLHLYEEASSED